MENSFAAVDVGFLNLLPLGCKYSSQILKTDKYPNDHCGYIVAIIGNLEEDVCLFLKVLITHYLFKQ